MKNSLTRATVVVGQLAVAAVMIQGCRTYTPGGRTALGGDTTELKQGTVVTLNGGAKTSSTVTPVAVNQPITPVTHVGEPGTYQEFVIDRDADMKDPYAGLNKSATKHVPAPPPSAVVAVPAGKRLTADGKYAMYVVKRGDSAGAIANRHGMTKADFVKLNAIANPDRIRIGQEFKVYADGKALASGKSTSTATSSDGNDYTVVSGDTLSQIAAKFGMRTSDLMAMNGIQNANMVRVGQKLRVSKSSTTRVAETGKKPVSDKPASSVKTEVKVEAPAVEPIDTSTTSPELDILVGMMTSDAAPKSLIEAKQSVAAVVPTVAKPLASAATAAKEHTVQEGDDVFALALKYGVRPLDIRRENNMTGSTLVPGSVIKIPAAQGN